MNDKRKIIAIFIIVAIVAALAAVATFFVIKSAKNEAKGSSQMTETATEDSSDKDDPQHTGDNAGSMSVTSDDGLLRMRHRYCLQALLRKTVT